MPRASTAHVPVDSRGEIDGFDYAHDSATAQRICRVWPSLSGSDAPVVAQLTGALRRRRALRRRYVVYALDGAAIQAVAIGRALHPADHHRAALRADRIHILPAQPTATAHRRLIGGEELPGAKQAYRTTAGVAL